MITWSNLFLSMCSFYWISIWLPLSRSLSYSRTLIEIVKMTTRRTRKKAHDLDAIPKKKTKMCIQLFEHNLTKKPTKCNHIVHIQFHHLVRRKWLFFGEKMCTVELLLKQLHRECSLLLVWITRIYFRCLNRTIECQTWVFRSLAFDAVLVNSALAAFLLLLLILFRTNIIGNFWWLPI